MEMSRLNRTDSLCPSPDQLLLSAVKQNDINIIRKLIRQDENLLTYIYGHPYDNPILYIAIDTFSRFVLKSTVETLIELGANLFYSTPEDDYQEAIHYAVKGKNHSILETIIKNIKTEGKLNAVTKNGNTALNLLIKEEVTEEDHDDDFEKCLMILLKSNINVNIPDKKNKTPIFVAASKNNWKTVEMILELRKDDIDIDSYRFREKTARDLIMASQLFDNLPELIKNNNELNTTDRLFSYLRSGEENSFITSNLDNVDAERPEGTLLQLACHGNWKRIVNYLLENKADVMKTTEKNRKTPIEITGENGFWKTFETLLPRYKTIPENLLLILLRNSVNETTPEISHRKCLELLLNSDKEFPVNVTSNGNSALHYASKYTNSKTILNLLRRGASLGNKNDFNCLPIEDISPKVLKQHFDNCVTVTRKPETDKQNTIVTFDYRSLMPSVSNDIELRSNKVDVESKLMDSKESYTKETDVLMEMAKIPELNHLLKHPLITSLLYLKWHKIRMFFYINLIFYCLFVVSLFSYIFIEKPEDYKFIYLLSKGVLVFTYIVLIIREVSQILIAPKKYFRSFENYLELALIITTGCIIANPDKEEDIFKQLSAATILLSALEMTLLIGQHPSLSTYIVIFRTVCLNFFKFLLWYSLLIIAFAFSFYKLFKTPEKTPPNNDDNGNNFFKEPSLTFIKIIVMLTGEFDASNLNFDDISNRVLFLFFVLLIPIILFNLLNGLAVSDTQTIKNDAEIIGYIERINHIAYIENMMLGTLVPSTLLCLFGRCVCCCGTESLRQRGIVKWLSRKNCLFPYTYDDYKVKIEPYQKGKVRKDEELEHVRCKRLKEVYLDGKTTKRIKEMIRDRNDEECEMDERRELEEARKVLRDIVGKICVKCKDDVQDFLYQNNI